jgi:hypothetical protein
MNLQLRHAAALSLVGWYLMMPPMTADLDQSCKPDHIVPAMSDLAMGLIVWTSPFVINQRRCDVARHSVEIDATIGEWQQVAEFEQLAECQARRDQNQALSGNEQALAIGVAKVELLDEGKSHPSDDELHARAELIRLSIDAQVAGEKCIATDDPRLKGN